MKFPCPLAFNYLRVHSQFCLHIAICHYVLNVAKFFFPTIPDYFYFIEIYFMHNILQVLGLQWVNLIYLYTGI